jgi:microsomal dipeptidase-like Zn-dependent dipeptidase
MEGGGPAPAEVARAAAKPVEARKSADGAEATDPQPVIPQAPPQPKITPQQIAEQAKADQAALGEVREEIDELKDGADSSKDSDKNKSVSDKGIPVVRMGSSDHATRMEAKRARAAKKHPGIVDLHIDGGNRTDDHGIPFDEAHQHGREFTSTDGAKNADNASLPGMVEGGYIAGLANAFPSIEGRMPTHDELWGEYRKHAGAYEQAVLRNPDIVAMAATQEEFVRALQEGRIALVKSIEGLYVPADAKGLRVLERLAEDGVRNFGIIWNERNGIASPHSDEAKGIDQGLTPFGVDVVQQLAATPGMVIDVSHASAKSMADILKIAGTESGKVIATHSGLRDKNTHSRNLPIEIAQAIGENGLIGIPLNSNFLKAGEARATADDVVRRIVELRQVLGGSEHIALGTDLGGMAPGSTIPGLDDMSTFGEVLYDRMVASNEFRPQEIEGIFGANAVRYLTTVLPKK